MTVLTDFPVLALLRDDGDDALLGRRLTAKEQTLFHEMDQATLRIAADSDLEAYYEIIIPVGERHGLNVQQAIAFWTRTTFCIFEP